MKTEMKLNTIQNGICVLRNNDLFLRFHINDFVAVKKNKEIISLFIEKQLALEYFEKWRRKYRNLFEDKNHLSK